MDETSYIKLPSPRVVEMCDRALAFWERQNAERDHRLAEKYRKTVRATLRRRFGKQPERDAQVIDEVCATRWKSRADFCAAWSIGPTDRIEELKTAAGAAEFVYLSVEDFSMLNRNQQG